MDIPTLLQTNKIQRQKYLERTGIRVDIQNLGKNKRCLAVREHNTAYSIHSGVHFRKRSIETAADNFTNMYDLYWDPRQVDIVPEIHSSNTPFFLYDQIKKDPRILAVINGAFYFLTDEAKRTPAELNYNLCIRKGMIFGLPSTDQPIAFISNGTLSATETNAEGIIRIGNKKLNWIGAKSKILAEKKAAAVLYNSRCAEVKRFRDPKTNIQIGVLDSENITTPKNPLAVDLLIKRSKDKLIVSRIKKGGGSHFFDGLFILQLSQSDPDIKIGDTVIPVSLDGLLLTKMESAITIGKSVHDAVFNDSEAGTQRDARSILAQDKNGFIHLIVFDGSKYIPGFKGVSARDIAPFFGLRKFNWAYFLDGGGSSRIIFRDENKLHYLANELAFRKMADGNVLWDWRKSRLIASSLAIKLKK